jgi:hypothetical protein
MIRNFSSRMVGVAGLAALTLSQPAIAQSQPAGAAIDYGDDSGDYANDDECDDSRFSGTGMAGSLSRSNRLRDASDCRKGVEEGRLRIRTSIVNAPPIESIDFGDEAASIARNGECDDPRFRGRGMADAVSEAGSGHDASDCRVAYRQERIVLASAVQRYSDHIVWGDDSGSFTRDSECDDMRFTGEAMASGELSPAQVKKDATDCREAYEMGTVDLDS